MKNTNNPELQRVFEWFLSSLKPTEWRDRKNAIEKHLESVLTPKNSLKKAISHESLSVQTDKIGWYLYLAEMILTEPTKYEPIQGARVIPIFERLGTDFELLREIGGIDQKVKKLLSLGRKIPEPDSALFEILVALLWKRNGWQNVEFIPETSQKRSDIRAASGNTEWFIECKRLSPNPEYSQKERKKWLKMWRYLRDYLVDKQIPAVLEIVFHVELETLSDDFLVKQLSGKLPLLSSPCIVLSNKQWQVSFDSVNFERARAYLAKFYVKIPSDQLAELVGGYRDPNRGFTSVVLGQNARIGRGMGNNKFLKTMDFAACAFWHCDADRSIEIRARDIRRHLADAVKQLPKDKKSVIHVGLETLDGVLVEAERYKRICNTVINFDNSGKDLRWIYCHLFQSYAPPDQDWVLDETIYYFSHTDFDTEQPLVYRGTMASIEYAADNGVHWLRDTP